MLKYERVGSNHLFVIINLVNSSTLKEIPTEILSPTLSAPDHCQPEELSGKPCGTVPRQPPLASTRNTTFPAGQQSSAGNLFAPPRTSEIISDATLLHCYSITMTC